MSTGMKEVHPAGGKGFARRDMLLSIERKVQRRWEEAGAFLAESRASPPAPEETFVGNFPYPCVNGSLHLGHAFPISKLEFASAFHRLCGRRVLLPFAFLCTGTPTKAIAREIRRFGVPLALPEARDELAAGGAGEKSGTGAGAGGRATPVKSKNKRSEAPAESGGDEYQWEIMRSFGLSDEEIPKFQDPCHWVTHFPALARDDLKAFGLGCDWRRSFIAADTNPFYGSFLRWKMKKLMKAVGKTEMSGESEKKEMSRPGSRWHTTRGKDVWKKGSEDCLSKINLYSEEAKNGFEHTSSCLNQGPCSPWDDQFLVDSLSNSTVCMAYSTVAHLVQNGDMYGSDVSSVKPEQMIDEVWDYVFCGGSFPATDIPSRLLNKMKQEFHYWYPFDWGVPGIYNHTALLPEHQWPGGFRCNRHIMLNSEKMSKSAGNFKTLKQAIDEFSADATRFCLADAGDGTKGANFVTDTANAAILRLTKELTWMEEVLASKHALRTGPRSTYADHVFANEINIAIKLTKQHFGDFMFREALKTGFYDLQAARDGYRLSCGFGGMNGDLLWRFLDVQARLIAPICPHYAEYVWKEILKKDGLVINAGWPSADTPDLILRRTNKYLQDTILTMRKLKEKAELGTRKPKKKVPTTPTVERKWTVCIIYVNEQYDGWKKSCLRILQSRYDQQRHCFSPNHEILAALKGTELGNELFEKLQEECIPFLKRKKAEAMTFGLRALDVRLPFSEIDVLIENADLIKRQLQLDHLEICLSRMIVFL